jgi:hypothetical protein
MGERKDYPVSRNLVFFVLLPFSLFLCYVPPGELKRNEAKNRGVRRNAWRHTPQRWKMSLRGILDVLPIAGNSCRSSRDTLTPQSA